MTNIEIAEFLLEAAKAGRLEPIVLQPIFDSLQHGAPVAHPAKWLQTIGPVLVQFQNVPPLVATQLTTLAAELERRSRET